MGGGQPFTFTLIPKHQGRGAYCLFSTPYAHNTHMMLTISRLTAPPQQVAAKHPASCQVAC